LCCLGLLLLLCLCLLVGWQELNWVLTPRRLNHPLGKEAHVGTVLQQLLGLDNSTEEVHNGILHKRKAAHSLAMLMAFLQCFQATSTITSALYVS
jgi:hypothetical protein